MNEWGLEWRKPGRMKFLTALRTIIITPLVAVDAAHVSRLTQPASLNFANSPDMVDGRLAW